MQGRGGGGGSAIFCRVIVGFFDKETFEQGSEEGGKEQTYGYVGEPPSRRYKQG